MAAIDGTPSISLTGTIKANGFYVLERTSDSTLPEITANQIYTGALGNSGEDLQLKNASSTVIDEVNQWYAGNNTTKATMERVSASVAGTDASNWITATETYGEVVLLEHLMTFMFTGILRFLQWKIQLTASKTGYRLTDTMILHIKPSL